MAAIRKARDTSLKIVLDEPELFVEFLRDFIPINKQESERKLQGKNTRAKSEITALLTWRNSETYCRCL